MSSNFDPHDPRTPHRAFRADARPSLRDWAAMRAPAIALFALSSLWLAACAGNQEGAATSLAADVDESAQTTLRASEPATKPQVSDLALQAQRDVDEWNKLRATQASPQADAAPAAGDAGPAARAAAIVWTDTQGASAPGAAPGAGAGTGIGAPGRGQKSASTAPSPNPPLATLEPSFASPSGVDSAAPTPPFANSSLATSATPTIAANASGSAPSDADRFQNLLVELSRELYRQAADSDMPMRQLLLIAATTLVNPDRAIDPNLMPGLTERERILLASLQSFFTDVGKELASSGDPEAIAAAVERLRKLITTDPELRLANATLCSGVEGFGKIKPFEPRKFLAHSDQQVIVYVEVDKFTSEANAKGEFVTELAQQLVIYSDRDGIPVWQEDWQTAVDVSRTKRTDFFMRQIVTLPKALSVGQYQLKLRVRDNKSKAEAETSVPFEMVADPKMAAGSVR